MTQTDPLPRPTTSTDPDVDRSADEPVDLVPAALRSALGRARRATTAADVGALAIVLLQLVPMAYLVVPGSLYTDDLRAQGYAAGRSWWPFVVQSNGTHVSVLARTYDWATVRWAPLEHWPAVVVTLGLRVALVAVLWWLLRDLFGPRPAALLPLALVAVTPALVPTTAWNRQALPNLFVVTMLLAATALHVRWLRSGRTGLLLGAAGCIVLGLLMFEKAVAIGPWLVLVTLLLPEAAGVRARLRLALRAWPAMVLYLLLDALFVALYLLGPYQSPGSDGGTNSREVVAAVQHLLGDTLAVGLLGGPLRWRETSIYYGTSDSPTWLSALCVTACALLVVGTVLRRRRAAVRTWLLLLGFVVVAFPVVAAGRLGAYGASIGSTYRLWADVVVVAVLTAALAVLPLRPGADPLPVVAPGTEGGDRRQRSRVSSAAVAALVGVLSLAVLATSVLSTVSFARRWHRNPTGAYLAAVRSGTAHGVTSLAPLPLPASVMPFWMDPDYDVEQLLAPLHRGISVHDADHGTAMLTAEGAVVPARFEPRTDAGPGPNGFCGRFIGPGGARRIMFAHPVAYRHDDVVRLALLVGGGPSAVEVSAVTDTGHSVTVPSRGPIRLSEGPHVLLARAPFDRAAPLDPLGAPREVVVGLDVRAVDPLVHLCVVSAAYGSVRPATGGAS
ncbi:MAG TPA: hypothetical protein VFS29_06700 [Motilibacteraceae bacterium]|nr:hypothetical protein [Motilibacteraceae bacterium]